MVRLNRYDHEKIKKEASSPKKNEPKKQEAGPSYGERELSSTKQQVVLATTLRLRLVGLLNKKVCAQGETLVIAPCKSIHTFGMREPLDIAFVDAYGFVLSVHNAVPPARLQKNTNAAIVLERRSRFSTPWYHPGQTLTLAPVRIQVEEEVNKPRYITFEALSEAKRSRRAQRESRR